MPCDPWKVLKTAALVGFIGTLVVWLLIVCIVWTGIEQGINQGVKLCQNP